MTARRLLVSHFLSFTKDFVGVRLPVLLTLSAVHSDAIAALSSDPSQVLYRHLDT